MLRLSSRTFIKRRTAGVMALVAGGMFALGFLESCDDRLVALTRFIEPCGTIFANCAPGDFQIRAADIGDGCIDPACTVPGGCGEIPLGTFTDVCP